MLDVVFFLTQKICLADFTKGKDTKETQKLKGKEKITATQYKR